ncbi:MAG: hypothetical protein H0U45_07105 [Tatlockia sp.]|nr:hypothetical protein [Tatlockia sp.]
MPDCGGAVVNYCAFFDNARSRIEGCNVAFFKILALTPLTICSNFVV